MRFGPIDFSDQVTRGVALAFGSAAVFLLLALAIVGLVWLLRPGPPIEGEVLEKWHEDREDNSYWTPVTTCSGGYNDQPRTCFTHMQRVLNIDDEDWVLQVRQTFEDGRVKVRRAEVGKDLYYDCEAGDWYSEEAKTCEAR